MTDKPISELIRERIKAGNTQFFCNDNISKYMYPGDADKLVDEVTGKMEELLQSLVIDTGMDHNTKGTAKRVAKMFIQETFEGRYTPPPDITAFPNVAAYDQLYVAGPITIRSVCAHHLQNIVGKAYIGIYPGKDVIGLSKFNRMINWIASRPQIQEEMTIQIADMIEKETGAEGLAVLVQAEHHCMTGRGVREHQSAMTTSVMRGKMRNEPSLKTEFFNIVGRMP